MQNEILYHFFTDDDFLVISKKIKEMEKITSGEIRVSIKESKPFGKKNSEVRSLAEAEFFGLEMEKTRDKTGILIFVILSERQFYILADSGINAKVEQSVWDEVRDQMQIEFRAGHFTEGIVLAIERIGSILSEHFPIKSDDTNELSNKVVL
jgi:uncharacterized membrane protein